ncbi:MAG: hypothetical protein AAFQ94_25580, partial [Bacteroidota bacterium]
MTAIIVFIVIILGINTIPFLHKRQFPGIERILIQVGWLVTIIYLAFFIISFYGIKLRGSFLNAALGYTLLMSYLLIFGVVRPNSRKFIIVLVAIPVMILCLYIQVLNQSIYEHKFHKNLNLTIYREGFLACGEIIRINKPYFGILNKEILYDSNQCLIGINKVETIEVNQ